MRKLLHLTLFLIIVVSHSSFFHWFWFLNLFKMRINSFLVITPMFMIPQKIFFLKLFEKLGLDIFQAMLNMHLKSRHFIQEIIYNEKY